MPERVLAVDDAHDPELGLQPLDRHDVAHVETGLDERLAHDDAVGRVKTVALAQARGIG